MVDKHEGQFYKVSEKSNEMTRSGAPASRLRKYVYHDQLLFLKKVAMQNETHDSLSHSPSINEEEGEETVTIETRKRKKNTVDEVGLPRESKRSNKQKMSAFEERIIQTLEVPPKSSQHSFQDRHMAFFAGIVPSLNNLTEDQICDFQIGVLRLIQSIKRRGNTIPANNMHLNNDYVDIGQAPPQIIPPFYSVKPNYTQHAIPQTTLVPFNYDTTAAHRRTAQEVLQNDTAQNFDAPSTIVRPPSTHTSEFSSPSYSTVSSEESQSMHLFE